MSVGRVKALKMTQKKGSMCVFKNRVLFHFWSKYLIQNRVFKRIARWHFAWGLRVSKALRCCTARGIPRWHRHRPCVWQMTWIACAAHHGQSPTAIAKASQCPFESEQRNSPGKQRPSWNRRANYTTYELVSILRRCRQSLSGSFFEARTNYTSQVESIYPKFFQRKGSTTKALGYRPLQLHPTLHPSPQSKCSSTEYHRREQ